MMKPPPGAPSTTRSQNARKVAVLLTSIGDENCAAVLRHMTEDQIHEVTREITILGGVPDEERRDVLRNFEEMFERGRLFEPGGIAYVTSVLISAFGPETGKRMAERVVKSLGTETASIDSLQKADPQHLAKVVQREHPQTIALVLSHVGPSHAAKLLSALPAEVRSDVIGRMAVLDQISPEVVNKIAKIIGAKLKFLGESSLESYGGVRAVAEVLNRVDSSTSDSILTEITEADFNLGETIRNLMFVFDDLMRLDSAAMRTIVGKLDRKVLVTALKGCSAQVKRHFTSFMSERAAEMLQEDMEALGPVRIREVEEAQQMIVATARQLETQGAVSLKPNGGDQFVV
jgi:flagellar motor switch protein FliG